MSLTYYSSDDRLEAIANALSDLRHDLRGLMDAEGPTPAFVRSLVGPAVDNFERAAVALRNAIEGANTGGRQFRDYREVEAFAKAARS